MCLNKTASSKRNHKENKKTEHIPLEWSEVENRKDLKDKITMYWRIRHRSLSVCTSETWRTAKRPKYRSWRVYRLVTSWEPGELVHERNWARSRIHWPFVLNIINENCLWLTRKPGFLTWASWTSYTHVSQDSTNHRRRGVKWKLAFLLMPVRQVIRLSQDSANRSYGWLEQMYTWAFYPISNSTEVTPFRQDPTNHSRR